MEKCFLPADTYEALQEELPDAKFIDAVYLLEELRAVKQPHELTLLKEGLRNHRRMYARRHEEHAFGHHHVRGRR